MMTRRVAGISEVRAVMNLHTVSVKIILGEERRKKGVAGEYLVDVLF